MPESVRSEEAIFLAASQLATAQERDAYLRGACGDNLELRQQVERLLAAHDASRGPLDRSPPGLNYPATIDQPVLEKPGTRIGPYKLLQQVGEGGMGVVFMAEQTEPVQRKVALKLIKPGMDTGQVVARFEAERQALALMDHVNIARVLDAGTTESGRPYFVMELVHGVPITRYCDDNRLTPQQRLELFIPVCQAIQHAHQKGIIHRDVKPSNVMVTLHDGKPVPKVIDFGVAKATEQRLTERTLFTQYGTMIGTFEYMSPEQAEMSGLGVDTRSDIYSLGVLLYELLTGSTPLTARRIREAAYDEVLRMIREEEPPRPSTRLSESGEALASISARRHTDPARLTSLVRGELDWIVMKCLEKDRNRRYESANAFAADVQRYLFDEPVLACPPSTWYRLRKFARRNKAGLAVVAAAGLAAIAAIVGLVASNLAISQQKTEKQIAYDGLKVEKLRADENLARARQAVKTFLVTASESELLQTGDFQDVRRRLLESALPFYRELAEQSQDDPDLELERVKAIESLGFLQREMGNLEQAVQEFATAEEAYRQLADRHPERTDFLGGLAAATTGRAENLADLEKIDDAEQAHRQAMELLERLVAEPGANDELRITLGRNCNSLGVLLYETNRLDEAESALRRAIQVREQIRDAAVDSKEARGNLAQSALNLGLVLRRKGRIDDAILQYQNAAKLFAEMPMVGPATDQRPDPRALKGQASALNNLGVLYREAGRMEEAAAATREALTMKETLAEAYPSVPLYQLELARAYSNLGVLYGNGPNDGQSAEARKAYEKAITIYERLAAGSTDRARQAAIELAGTYSNLGRLLGDGGQLEESLPWLTKAVVQLEAAFRREPRLAKARDSLVIACWTRAVTLAGLQRYEAALADWDRAIEVDEGPYENPLRMRRASNLLNLNDHARASLDAEAVAQSPQASAEQLFQAACVFAMSSQLAKDDANLVESYGARGVRALRLSAAKERPNLQAWQESGDLKALHSRDDFRRMIEELSAQQPPGEPAAQPSP